MKIPFPILQINPPLQVPRKSKDRALITTIKKNSEISLKKYTNNFKILVKTTSDPNTEKSHNYNYIHPNDKTYNRNRKRSEFEVGVDFPCRFLKPPYLRICILQIPLYITFDVFIQRVLSIFISIRACAICTSSTI